MFENVRVVGQIGLVATPRPVLVRETLLVRRERENKEIRIVLFNWIELNNKTELQSVYYIHLSDLTTK